MFAFPVNVFNKCSSCHSFQVSANIASPVLGPSDYFQNSVLQNKCDFFFKVGQCFAKPLHSDISKKGIQEIIIDFFQVLYERRKQSFQEENLPLWPSG